MGKRNRDNQATTTEEVIPPVPDKPQQCHYFVKRKKRYCHLPARKANKYCGEHLQHEDNVDLKDGVQDPKRIRIPCPYDPNQ
jgi:tRNA:m4X modification enzyme